MVEKKIGFDGLIIRPSTVRIQSVNVKIDQWKLINMKKKNRKENGEKKKQKTEYPTTRGKCCLKCK